MATSTRDRITVDLRGLRPRLLEMARRQRMSLSELVRQTLAAGTGEAGEGVIASGDVTCAPSSRARICLRMPAPDIQNLKRSAAAAGLDPGAFVALTVAGVDSGVLGPDRPSMLAAMRASNVELSQLSRRLRHLTALLSQGSVKAALEYRDMLDGLDHDVRLHLTAAAEALRQLTPARRPSRSRALDARPSAGSFWQEV